MSTQIAASNTSLTNFVHYGSVPSEPIDDAKHRRQLLASDIRRQVEPFTSPHEWRSLRESASFIDQIAYKLWHSDKPFAEQCLHDMLSKVNSELPTIRDLKNQIGNHIHRKQIENSAANLLRQIVDRINNLNSGTALEELLDKRLLNDGKYEGGCLDKHLRNALGENHGDVRFMNRPGWLR